MRLCSERTKLCRVEMWRGGLGCAYLLPALWSAGASLAQPCSVSTSRSSNRTGGFPASGSRRRRTLLRVTRSATSEHLLGLPGSSPIPRPLVALRVSLQLRPLPSTGVTRLPRYCGPLRHPTRPGLALTSCRLTHLRSPLGLPVLRLLPVACMPSPIPRQDRATCSLILLRRRRPSPNERRVGSCIACFEACSAFTRVTACNAHQVAFATFFTEGFSGFVTSTAASIVTGRNEPAPGRDFHPLWTSAFARRTFASGLGGGRL